MYIFIDKTEEWLMVKVFISISIFMEQFDWFWKGRVKSSRAQKKPSQWCQSLVETSQVMSVIN